MPGSMELSLWWNIKSNTVEELVVLSHIAGPVPAAQKDVSDAPYAMPFGWHQVKSFEGGQR